MLTVLQEYKAREDRESFREALAYAFPRLRQYVAARLRSAVRRGAMPKRKYDVDDVVDEVYLRAFDRFAGTSMGEDALKAMLFRLADERLAELIEDEALHRNEVSAEELMAQELSRLEEDLTADAEGERALVDELDDVSYHPHGEEEPQEYALDTDFEDRLIEWLEAGERVGESEEARASLGQVYDQLPSFSRIVLEMHVIGGLSAREIAEARLLRSDEVDRLLTAIRRRFLAALGIE